MNQSEEVIQQTNQLKLPLRLSKSEYQQDKIISDGESKFDALTNYHIWAYGIGHFINDLTAACWFNYLLYFLTNVIVIDEQDNEYYAGLVMLSGQIADGIATPLVGYYSDRTQTEIGKRKPWYIVGVAVVCICFTFIFSPCTLCYYLDSNSTSLKIANFIIFPSVFNIGWACIQISHMSLLPSLTISRKRRDSLNNLRNTFSYVANFLVLLLAFILFATIHEPYIQFKSLSIIAVILGFGASFYFIYAIDEVKLATQDVYDEDLVIEKQTLLSQSPVLKKYLIASPQNNKKETIDFFQDLGPIIKSLSIPEQFESPQSNQLHNHLLESELFIKEYKNYEYAEEKAEGEKIITRQKVTRLSVSEHIMNWQEWFLEIMFYQYGVVYMCSRMTVNVASSLMPYYLITVLEFADQDTKVQTNPLIAIIPIILYLSSILASSQTQKLYLYFGRSNTYTLGVFLLVAASIVMMNLDEESRYIMFFVAVLIGAAQSICLNTSLNLIAEVIGIRGSSGAFVYGAYSFLEKIANGLNSQSFKDNEANFIRFFIVTVPTVASLFGWILITIGGAKDYSIIVAK